jgi:hypothetical protein
MIGGLAAAWKWEYLGGLISVIGLIGAGILNPKILASPVMYLFLIPGILFMLVAWQSRSFRSAGNNDSEDGK